MYYEAYFLTFFSMEKSTHPQKAVLAATLLATCAGPQLPAFTSGLGNLILRRPLLGQQALDEVCEQMAIDTDIPMRPAGHPDNPRTIQEEIRFLLDGNAISVRCNFGTIAKGKPHVDSIRVLERLGTSDRVNLYQDSTGMSVRSSNIAGDAETQGADGYAETVFLGGRQTTWGAGFPPAGNESHGINLVDGIWLGSDGIPKNVQNRFGRILNAARESLAENGLLQKK